jgi:simple sugar transport system permease protein
MSSTSLGGLLRRPEAGAALGLIAVLIFFAFFGGVTFLKPAGMASWLNVAANLGVIAIPLGLLMIAGELDISVGAMVPFGAMTVAVVSGHYDMPIWLGVAMALSFGVIVGLVNGILVVKTAVPSLIVTLGSLFAVQGVVLGLTVLITKSTSGVGVEGPAKAMFGDFLFGGQLQVMALWWLGLTALYIFFVHFALRTGFSPWRRRFGAQCRNSDGPADHHPVRLVGHLSAFVGMSQAILYNSAQVAAGNRSSSTPSSRSWSGGLADRGFGSVGIFFSTITFAIVTRIYTPI